MVLLGALGCVEPAEPDPSDDTDVDSDSDTDSDSVVDPDACVPALAVTADRTEAVPLGIVQLTATGGTGAYRFTLLEPERGVGFVESRIGRVLVGEIPGIPHVIEVTDDGCDGSAEITLEVVPNLTVVPDRATVLPGVTFELDISGGLSEPECVLVGTASGATLDGCVYTAGELDGLDRIDVSDPESGERVVVRITVQAGSDLGVAAEGWWIPLGGAHTVEPASGSDRFDITVLDGEDVVRVEGRTVTGLREGEASLVIADRFSGHEARVPVHVVGSVLPPLERTARGRTGRVLSGDFDQDGYADVMLGLPNSDLGALEAGAVLVYRGGPDGLDPEPHAVFGPRRAPGGGYLVGLPAGSGLGEDFAVGDHDGDGKADLALGAFLQSAGMSRNGAIYLISDFMSADPDRALDEPFYVGERGEDRLGSGVGLCDFDGDGWQDLAVGAYQDEDNEDETAVVQAGAIHLFRGGPSGFAEAPSTIRYGEIPDGDGGWTSFPVRLGRRIRTADLDGDGRCDLLSTTYHGNVDGSGQDGIVTLYRGHADTLVEPHPHRMLTYTGTATNAVATWAVDLGDLDGDGVLDLALGSYQLGRGTVHVYPGAMLLADGPVVRSISDATWAFVGDQGGDQTGQSVSVGDADGDGLDDLLIGAFQDEYPAGVNNTGQAWLLTGAKLRTLSPGTTTLQAVGATAIERHEGGYGEGVLVSIVGDTDGDGDSELLVHALRGPSNAFAGYPEVLSLDGEDAWPLDLPHGWDDTGVGRSLAFGDATGDGRPDLLVGAYGAAHAIYGVDAGSVWSFARAGDGFSRWPVEQSAAFYARNSSDRVGYGLTADTDLDGDGYDDLVVVARSLDRYPTLPTTYAPRTCGGRVTRPGAVFVYRGGPRGFADEPALALYGPGQDEQLQRAPGIGDFDGDGRDDLMVASTAWGRGGGVYVLRGQDLPDDGTTRVICLDPADRWEATETGAAMGTAIAPLGDLDGDGCDDVAVGAPFEDRGRQNQGVIRIFWGGGEGCARRPSISQLVSGTTRGSAGEALASGQDLDGDGLVDLAIGAPRLTSGNSGGVVWVVSGARLLDLARTDLVGELPPAEELAAPRLETLDRVVRIRDGEPGAWFGSALVMLPGTASRGPRLLATRPRIAGGGAYVYALDNSDGTGFVEEPLPVGLLAGEAIPGSLGTAAVGFSGSDGTGFIAVGAPTAEQFAGSVYVLPVGE